MPGHAKENGRPSPARSGRPDRRKENEVKKKTKRERRKNLGEARVYIQATFNNTVVTVTDISGNTIAWSSAGSLGFKGAKKSTPFAAQSTTETAVNKALEYGIQEVDVFVKGPGVGRESAIRAIGNLGLRVRLIVDITPIPHNGCRPQKARRV
ncbi:MAG: 30S ribosomal protein S11 [Spirochaetales bacterium]|nr:30S ribosomal protein S11 [Spirochaetales bacterium]